MNVYLVAAVWFLNCGRLPDKPQLLYYQGIKAPYTFLGISCIIAEKVG